MSKWNWLENPAQRPGWLTNLRIVFKAALLFVLLNLLFALLTPVEALGRISVYNTLLPGRDRLPYGENPTESYNLSLFNIPAMFAAHEIVASPADDEFRVLVTGDSATWGWLLSPDATTTAQLNALDLTTDDGRRVVFYNTGYPALSLTKDLLLLDYALRYEPDLVVWLVTLESFVPGNQLVPLAANNPTRTRDLIERYDLATDPDDPAFVEHDFIDETIVGQRRALANWLRLQGYAVAWASTGIDHAIRDYDPLTRDFSTDVSWEGYAEPVELTAADLAFDVLGAGMQRIEEAGIPALLVNEPIFITDGAGSDLHYNLWYPRWAYDAYRDLLAAQSESAGWTLLDLWDALPPDVFTDSPVHMDAGGAQTLAQRLTPALETIIP